MLAQIENTEHGYIVGVYLRDGAGNGAWHRLRNFGDRQGDAIMFRDYDIPDLSDGQINILVREFKVGNIYERISKNRYKKIK